VWAWNGKTNKKKKKGKEGNCGSNTMAACDELKKDNENKQRQQTNNDNKQTMTTDKQNIKQINK